MKDVIELILGDDGVSAIFKKVLKKKKNGEKKDDIKVSSRDK